MLRIILSTAALLASMTFATAAEDSNATTKAASDHPGTSGASTLAPAAKQNSGNLSEKQMRTQPGMETSGSTAMPDAASGGSADHEMKQNLGVPK